MGSSDIIALFIIVAVCLATIIYFIIKNNGKNSRVSSILKSHPSLAMILLNCEKLPAISALSEDQIDRILSLSDNDWEEWEALSKKTKILADKYPQTLYEFINVYIPEYKKRVNYKNKIALFTPIPRRVKIAVASLYLEELRRIDADSESVWEEKNNLRLYATKIRQKYPEGYKSYCKIHKVKSPTYSEIASNKKHIAELQKLFDESKGYEGWEKKQEDFSSDYWQILKDVRSQDGRYTYNVSFNKPSRIGSLFESEFKVWQGFCESFSSFLKDKQTDSFLARFNKISEFEARERYFYDRVYDDIFHIITKIDEKIEGKLYVILIDRCSLNWGKRTYDYHYSHIQELLDDSEIHKINFSELPFENDNGDIGGVFILDFVTSNEELKNNCRLIIEHFNKSVPLIGYYSMEKELDEDELLKLSENNEGYLKSIEEINDDDEYLPFLEDKEDNNEEEIEDEESRDISLIKQRIYEVRKHVYFSYIAIPNTWIGEAGQSDATRAAWLSQPSKYHFRLVDKVGKIACEYSVNGRRTYQEFSIEGDKGDIDDVALFTYHLLKKMNLLEEFRLKGQKAVEFMNKQGILAYH
ncbi:MAG: hypothetical protein IKO20_09215 [Bacteroidaceae bacterium]|nr:hypothetical protein [Bacteroidaceae bacterium]